MIVRVLTFFLMGAVLMAATTTRAQTPPTDQPVPRTDQNSLTAHSQLLEKAKLGQVDLYFEGDSITRRWGATDYPELLANWNENFFGWNAANFGWGADGTENILWRLDDGELEGVNPQVIVLMAGTNNVGNPIGSDGEGRRVEEVTRGIAAILDALRSKAPEATIILMGILPRNDNMALMPMIDSINDNLPELADGERIRFLNINDRLADRNGKLYEGMTADNLHPSDAGYQAWADALRPILTQLLGPPAEVDLAPPATGNPAAQR